MPPGSGEHGYSNTEIPQNNLEKYLDVEKGDSFDLTIGSTTSSNSSGQNTTSIKSTEEVKIPDVVEVFKGMISTGFTPTKSQITDSRTNGQANSSNTWFAIFLQRLLKQRKNKGRNQN